MKRRPGGACSDFFSGEGDGGVPADPGVAQINVRPEPGHVRHHVANRDPLLAVLPELRDERRDRIRQSNAAALDERHRGRRRRDDFGQRRKIEDGVERHRLRRRDDGAPAVRLAEQDRVAATDEHHGARELAGANRVVDHAVQRVEPREIHARRLRTCGRRWLGADAESSHRGDQENGNQHGSSHAPIIATGWTGPPPALAAFRR